MEQNDIYLSVNKLVTDKPILILTQAKDRRIKFINNKIGAYCNANASSLINNSGFYADYIHPDDYKNCCDHLDGFLNYDYKEEKEILLRLKNKEGRWQKFCFKSRLYNWNLDNENPVVLTLAHKIPDCSVENPLEEENSLKLQDFEKKHYHLLESLDEGYCTVEMIFDENDRAVDYLFIEANAAFEKQINLTDVVGKTMRELICDHEDHWFETYGKVAKTGEPIRFQYLAEKLDNSWLDVYAFKTAEIHSNQVLILFKNITEQITLEKELKSAKQELEKKASRREKELQESKNLLQTVFDTTSLGVAVFKTLYDSDGNVEDFMYVRVNEVLYNMAANKEILGKKYSETTKYGIKMGMFDALKKVAKTGKPLDKEFYFDKEGYHNWFRVTARSQKELVVATIEDVSERKAEAQELKETLRFKRQLVRTSPETILIINLNTFTVRYINKDIFPEVGMTREKVEGMPLQDILPYVHPRDREKVMELHKKLLKSNDDDIYDIELRLKLKGNKWEWFSVRGKIFHRRDEAWVDEYVLLVRNITQQKNTQKALLKAEKFSIQGEIARTLAHELRNPLASIGMATEVLGKKLEGTQKKQVDNYLEILSRSTKTLNNLVSNLLNAANYSPAVLERTDLAKITKKTIDKAADRIYLTGIKVIKNFSGPYFIMADKNKLEIALLNIIVNASEATIPEKGVITLEINKHKTDFLLSITDNGHGLEEHEIDRLFEAFYTSKSTGVGVGLNSVKNILDDHDAKIEVSSKPNIGTTFKLYFHNADMA